jgi:hypothetical protein
MRRAAWADAGPTSPLVGAAKVRRVTPGAEADAMSVDAPAGHAAAMHARTLAYTDPPGAAVSSDEDEDAVVGKAAAGPLTPTKEAAAEAVVAVVATVERRTSLSDAAGSAPPSAARALSMGAWPVASPRVLDRVSHPRALALAREYASLPGEDVQEQALLALLERCSLSQLHFVAMAVMPYLQRDFISKLPTELALRILSFLDHRTLVRASGVSQQWRRLAHDEFLWKRMCLQRGYFFDFDHNRPYDAPVCMCVCLFLCTPAFVCARACCCLLCL